MRTFNTGATRNDDKDKLDLEGFISPLSLKRYAEYLHKHRIQDDGSVRASDNWAKGIPKEAYMKSLVRHLLDVWLAHRGHPHQESLEDGLCALIFNAQGMLHELLKAKTATEADYASLDFSIHDSIHDEPKPDVCNCKDLTHSGYVPRKGKVCGKCQKPISESEGVGV